MRDMLNKLVFVLLFVFTVVGAIHLEDGLDTHGALQQPQYNLIQAVGLGYFVSLSGAYFVLGAQAFYLACRLERARRLCFTDAICHIINALLYLLVGCLPRLSSGDEKTWRAIAIGLSFVLAWIVRHVRDLVFLRPPHRDNKGNIIQRGRNTIQQPQS